MLLFFIVYHAEIRTLGCIFYPDLGSSLSLLFCRLEITLIHSTKKIFLAFSLLEQIKYENFALYQYI